MKFWLIIGLVVAPLACAQAQQQEIEWKQTLNIPKGQNISRDRADILGIEFGDTFAEAKAKLEALYAEYPQPPRRNPHGVDLPRGMKSAIPPPPAVGETTNIFRFRQPGAATLYMATYVAQMEIDRDVPGVGEKKIKERISVTLSAPSSGHQVIAINRSIVYPEADQPRIDDLLLQMKAKFKAEPKSGTGSFSFQFDNGLPVPPSARPYPDPCQPETSASHSLEQVQRINENGKCDVVLSVGVSYGISNEHASMLSFSYADNERVKANRLADYAYLQSYIDGMRDKTRGTLPKL